MKKKRYFGLILCLVMMFSNNIFAMENTKNSNAKVVHEKIKEFEKEQVIYQVSEEHISASEEFDNMMKEIKNEDAFPSYYGGAYIEDGKLVVLLVNRNEEYTSKIKTVTKNSNVIIQYVDVPLNYLIELQANYRNTYEELYARKNDKEIISSDEKELLETLRGSYIDEETNELVVTINSITEEKIKCHKNLFGEDKCVRYEEGGYLQFTSYEWRPGRTLYTSSGTLSTGYRVYYIDSTGTRYNGFVTAGHGLSTNGLVYRASSRMPVDILGQCKTRKFSGSVDAAFVAITDTNYVPSNTVHYSDQYGSTTGTLATLLATTIYVGDVAKGDYVYKVGGVSYMTMGLIESTSEDCYYSGQTISNLVKTTALNLQGDSGGCAYIYKAGQYRTLGTMACSDFKSNIYEKEYFEYSYICRAKYAVPALGVVKY